MSGLKLKKHSSVSSIFEIPSENVSYKPPVKKRKITDINRDDNFIDFDNGKYLNPSELKRSEKNYAGGTLDEEILAYDKQFALSAKSQDMGRYLRMLASKYRSKAPLTSLTGASKDISEPKTFRDIVEANPTVFGLQQAMRGDLNPLSENVLSNESIYRNEKMLQEIKKTHHDVTKPSGPLYFIDPKFEKNNEPLAKSIENRVKHENLQESLKRFNEFLESGPGKLDKIDEVDEKILNDEFEKEENLAREQVLNKLNRSDSTQTAKTDLNQPNAYSTPLSNSLFRREVEEEPIKEDFKPHYSVEKVFDSISPENSTVNTEKELPQSPNISEGGYLGHPLVSNTSLSLAITQDENESKYKKNLYFHCNGDAGYLEFVNWLTAKNETSQTVCVENHIKLNGPDGNLHFKNANSGESLTDFLKRMTDAGKKQIGKPLIFNGKLEQFQSTYGTLVDVGQDIGHFAICKFLLAHFNNEARIYGRRLLLARHTTMDDPKLTIQRMENNFRGPFIINVLSDFEKIIERKMTFEESPYELLFTGLSRVIKLYDEVYDVIIKEGLDRVLTSQKKRDFKSGIFQFLISNNISRGNSHAQWKKENLNLSSNEFLEEVILHCWFKHGKIPPNQNKVRKIISNSSLNPTHIYTAFNKSEKLKKFVSFYGLIHSVYVFLNGDDMSVDLALNEVWKEYSLNLQATNLENQKIKTNAVQNFLIQYAQSVNTYLEKGALSLFDKGELTKIRYFGSHSPIKPPPINKTTPIPIPFPNLNLSTPTINLPLKSTRNTPIVVRRSTRPQNQPKRYIDEF